MTLRASSNVGQREWSWRPGREGAGGAQSPVPSQPGQLSLRGSFSAFESGGGSYYWLQMTFASIYLLHFDFAFNFRSIHGVCAT